jgi:predicted nucleotidyltransferase
MNSMRVGQINVDGEELARICKKWGILKLEAFGSVLRSDFGPNSDVDLLVTYEDGAGPKSYAEQLQLEDSLSELFGNLVELVSKSRLEKSENYIRRDNILKSAELLYAA